ncbi:cysteine desulfurase [Aaosphaeria arxii CBS 175.79]|uniref:Cysteine desulfurase n=1 Tax=Aaosphaeria arxii CBS 175.79 TaxID=1450172 RepID=A0A6A5XWW7_9PLEO|nr:cysteine desulfurase [Aaosphaeria arxii CBS 175.79]KAF2017337.1 cysteine desulfurase [Aaosphaeria arxii CBS 175.79]
MEQIRAVLASDEIIEPSSPSYRQETQVWSAQKDLHPKLVAQPKDTNSLSRLLKVLNETDVEFNIRSGGCGSASSRGVLISMSAFDSFSFDDKEETVTIGAGQLWRHVDAKVEEFAPGYAVPGARCTYVGVGGGTLQGGLSWMSSEYGLTSDPQNMLDAEIVLMDGSVLWASSDPELLWALRGGGGVFGAVTALKIKAYRYPKDIYSGMITFGREALPELACRVSEFEATNTDPKVAMHLYCMDLIQGAFVGKPSVAGLGLMVYDAHGEEHGRNIAFKWALDIPGANDSTKSMNYREVNQLNDALEAIRGQTSQMMTAVAIPSTSEELIKRTWNWFDQTLQREPKLNAGTFVLIEIMQKPALNTVSKNETGWPRPDARHILQLGCGALAKDNSPDLHQKAVKYLADGAKQICDVYSVSDCLPRDFEEFHDPLQLFGANLGKLQAIKRRVDPNNRLRGAYNLLG